MNSERCYKAYLFVIGRRCKCAKIIPVNSNRLVPATVDSAIGSWRVLLTQITSRSKTCHGQSMNNFPLAC
jgi:hypothetical protein